MRTTEEENLYRELSTCVDKNNTEGLKDLIRQAKENSTTISKATSEALVIAAGKGNLEIVQALLDDGDVDIRYKTRALHIVAKNGHVEIVTTLIDLGAVINAKNEDGYTALKLAVQNGHADIIVELIERGADIKALDVLGSTMLEVGE